MLSLLKVGQPYKFGVSLYSYVYIYVMVQVAVTS